MTYSLNKEQQSITEEQIRIILEKVGFSTERRQVKNLIDPLTELLIDNVEQKKKISALEKITLPSLKKQNEKAKEFYDSREGSLLGLELNRFRDIQNKLEGLQNGFYLIGADSNLGKSTLSTNLCIDIMQSNQNVACLFFSLDDSAEDILTKMRTVIANTLKENPSIRIEINNIKTPKQLDSEKKLLINKSYNLLNEIDDSLFVLDQESVIAFKDIVDFIEKVKVRHERKKIVVFIDAIMNLDIQEDSAKQIRELNIIRANKLKELTKTYSIPLICTVELRKRAKPEEQPTMSDIIESAKYGYNGNVANCLF